MPNENGFASATLVRPDGTAAFCGYRPRDWIEVAIRLLGTGSRTDQRTNELASHLPILEAHQQIGRDVLVTTQQEFLAFRDRVPDANIKSAFEGLKIIGLYLRSLGNYTIGVRNGRPDVFGQDLFYWVLCRHRLPAMWTYFAACLRWGHSAHDGTDYLGNSILDRCVRVLQARDQSPPREPWTQMGHWHFWLHASRRGLP